MRLFRKKINLEVLKKINKQSMLKRYLSLIFGCFIVAVSYNLFLAPNNLVAGGIGGIAIILNNLFPINNFIVILICNLVLLGISYFLLEKEKTKATLLGSLLFPLFVKLTEHITVWIHIQSTELLLPAVFGAVMYGFGLGTILKAGFTTGGTDIINQILSKYLKISMGKSMLICDGSIIIASAFVFGPTMLMYSLIILYIISFMSDRVILGISDSKAFYIITKEEEAMKEYIIKYLNHGVTVFNAKGGFAKARETVLMCVLPTKDYYRLKEGIKAIDKNAFVVITDSYEVFGGE